MQRRMRSGHLRRWEWFARALFAFAVPFTLFMALDPKPPALPIDKFGDKFEHMLAFGVLAVLARLAFPRARALTILERLSFMGALIEVFQAIPALHRDCDWKDWVADTLAAGAALLVAEAARRRGLQARAASAAHG